MLRVVPPLAIALILLLSLPRQAAAALITTSPKTQVPAFSNGGSESRIGLLCHNDPINKNDPFGLEPIEISIQLDQLGLQASDNSLRASSDGYPRSQVIQETNGQLSLQNKINEGVPVKVPGFGSVVPKVMMEEKAEPDKGSTLAGIGHAHMDQTGRPAKSESGFSKRDYAAATGDKKKGLIGVPVYKVNQSDPTRVDRLTPEKTPGDKPTILRVR